MNVYIKIYQAKNGDCFLICFGETVEEKKHLLIDCGYVDTFQKYLKNDLIKIGKSGDDDLFRNFCGLHIRI